MLKYFLSFLFEIPVEKKSSSVNSFLEVSFHRGNYKLSTENAIYSFGTEYKVFADAFRKLNVYSKKIKKVLSLGFGIGSIPIILNKNPQGFKNLEGLKITGVEIDAVIIDLAKKYLDKNILGKTTFVCEDAFEFVKSYNGVFDLITIDIFIDSEVPEKFEQIDFLENTKKLLAENGILFYNRLAMSKEQEKKSMDFFNNNFKNIFPKGELLRLNKNLLLVAK